MAKKKSYYGGEKEFRESMIDETSVNARGERPGMIKEEAGAPSNFPRTSFIKMYAQNPSMSDMNIDDTETGLEKQMSGDTGRARSNSAKTRY